MPHAFLSCCCACSPAHALAGKHATVEFTPTTKGTYTMFRIIPGHREAGMVGKLIVE